MMDDFEKTPDPDGLQPRLPAGVDRAEFQNGAIQFERPDWTLFRTVATLSQKAGVPQKHLRRLVLKELVDNALDAGAGFVGVGPLVPKDRYFVQDDGPGLDGSPQEIARLFSINRPLVSTKLLRLPRRGALGNGLRVVAGAIAASRGRTLSPVDFSLLEPQLERVPLPVGIRLLVSVVRTMDLRGC